MLSGPHRSALLSGPCSLWPREKTLTSWAVLAGQPWRRRACCSCCISIASFLPACLTPILPGSHTHRPSLSVVPPDPSRSRLLAQPWPISTFPSVTPICCYLCCSLAPAAAAFVLRCVCSSRSSSAFSACVWAPPRALLFLSLPVLVACGLCRARAGLRSGSVMHLIIGCLHSKSSYICCPSPLSSGSHRRAFCQELALQLLSASRPGTGHRPRWRWTSPARSDPGSISVCFWYAASDIPVTTLKKEKHAVCLAEMLGRVPPPPPPPPHPPRGNIM